MQVAVAGSDDSADCVRKTVEKFPQTHADGHNNG